MVLLIRAYVCQKYKAPYTSNGCILLCINHASVDYKHFLWPGFSFILSRTPPLIHPALTALPLAVLVSMPQSPPGQSDSPTLAAEGQARAAVDI